MNREQLELLREWVRAEIWAAIASHDEGKNEHWDIVSMVAEEEKHAEARKLFEKAAIAITGGGFAYGRPSGTPPTYVMSLEDVSQEVK